MSASEDLDITASSTVGYRPAERKPMDELLNMDAEDESLKKWKASLGLTKNQDASPADDPRRVVVESISLEVKDRDDVVVDLSNEAALEKAKSNPFTIKEGAVYRIKVKFRVQHEVVSGLKYVQIVTRKNVRVDKSQQMLGSYGPQKEAYEKTFEDEEAPSGFLARGHYEAKSYFIDDDKHEHLKWTWSFDIKKDWQ